MRNIQGKVPESPVARFMMGVGFGVAISIPLFLSIDALWVRILFMASFGGIMGVGQVLAGSKSEQARLVTMWSLVLGIALLIVGIAVLLID